MVPLLLQACRKVKRLSIGKFACDEQGKADLISEIGKKRSLTKLELGTPFLQILIDSCINDKELNKLADELGKYPKLKKLNLSIFETQLQIEIVGNKVGPRGGTYIASILENCPSLIELNLSKIFETTCIVVETDIRAYGTSAIVHELRNHKSLTKLNLGIFCQ
eukprot:TRINITY_DN72533_c0_g1_i1.p2 TRINITY_DN72533_c0_g1~~TRINITY_DN72533_c0_g1_i1.p2  ORF type:complete len:164 (-),score=1.15 TRINITY_DN72533_c0_g1_i1:583-1074(-)